MTNGLICDGHREGLFQFKYFILLKPFQSERSLPKYGNSQVQQK